MVKKLIFLLVIVLSVVFVIYHNNNSTQDLANKQEDNIFNPQEVKLGDKIVGMTIDSLSLHQIQNSDRYSATVQFLGEVIVDGRYINYEDDEFLGDSVAFEVSSETEHRLPKLDFDKRRTWFVFNNQDMAKDIFGKRAPDGYAKVTIKDYLIRYAPTEVFNEARLVEVIDVAD
jgi:hypothetical protein